MSRDEAKRAVVLYLAELDGELEDIERRKREALDVLLSLTATEE